MSRPSFIGNYLEFLDDDDASYAGSDELLSIGSAVGRKLGLKKIGINIETMPPGRRTSWPHAESEEEEFAFVLEGTPDVWIDGEIFPLKVGDFVAFPAGTGITHTFLNNSLSTVRLLVGGDQIIKTNKINYPLHPARNESMKQQDRFWENAPTVLKGTHNGEPEKTEITKWNLPHIETDRLILRPFKFSDAKNIFAYASKPNVAELVTWDPHKSITEAEEHIKFGFTGYAQGLLAPLGVCLKTNPEVVIGSVGAFWSSKPHKVIELGAVLDDTFWGQGIIPEALIKLIEVSWSHYDVERIQARCKVGNTKSRRMLEKSGMNYEGTLKKSLFCKGKAWDMEIFCVVRL
jgi:uncharacterized cupin superfamily protein/RimJ/RimL family protein N-acetyltransferase